MFYGKPLRLSFARKQSDRITKERGTFDSGVLEERKVQQEKLRQVSVKNKELKKTRQMILEALRLKEMVKSGPLTAPLVTVGQAMGGPAFPEPQQPMAAAFQAPQVA